MTRRRGIDLADHLAALRREGLTFDEAWRIAAGSVPAAGNDGASAERYRYDAMRQAWYRGGKPCSLTRDLAAEESYGDGRKTRPAPTGRA